MNKCQLINRKIIKSHISYMQLDGLMSIFHFIHLQNVKMFTCNVFRLFFFVCFNFAAFFVMTTLLTDCRGHWRVPLLICAYELHGLLVLSWVLLLYVVGQASCSRPFLLVSLQVTIKTNLLAELKHQAPNYFSCCCLRETTS